MPEAPEVSYLVDYVNRHCKNKLLRSITIMKGRYHKHGPPKNFANFQSSLPLRLHTVSRKGKVSFMHFGDSWCVISKLGLTGWWYVNNDAPAWIRSTPNIRFDFEGGTTLYYVDPLSYGTLTITNNSTVVDSEIKRLAPDIITASRKDIFQRLEERPRLKDQKIEDLLIDQNGVVSGIGNYLKSEILYDARISPLRKVATISKEEWAQVLRSAKKTIRRMSKSMQDEDPDKYEQSMRVYQKTIDPYGNVIEKHKTKDGRTTFWVPSIQR